MNFHSTCIFLRYCHNNIDIVVKIRYTITEKEGESMLVQFTVKNFMSFKDEVTLDMTAINSYKEHEYNLIDLGGKEKYLPVASIYGANASGKSNFLNAFNTFRTVIRESMNHEPPLNKCYKPYFFQEQKENIFFEYVQIIDEIEYKYGFEYNETEIVLEWLYSKKLETNRQTTLLERTTDSIKLGASVSGECEIYASLIPKNTLALSFFQKLLLKTNIFKIVFQGIDKSISQNSTFYEGYDSFMLLKRVIDQNKKQLLVFLKEIDTGIVDIDYEEKNGNTEFFAYHTGIDQTRYRLPLHEESTGTNKCISIFTVIKVVLDSNMILFIDELNAKLHPLLTKYIVDLFYTAKDSSAQLIYTTHDTTLLDKRFFRRDQIWFVEKDEHGCSELTSLAEFKVRNDASFEKDYLGGVYGAIPFSSDKEGF